MKQSEEKSRIWPSCNQAQPRFIYRKEGQAKLGGEEGAYRICSPPSFSITLFYVETEPDLASLFSSFPDGDSDKEEEKGEWKEGRKRVGWEEEA